jgi:hypothetical protein
MGLEGIVSKRLSARALSVGSVARLDQGQEPRQPGDDQGAGRGVVVPPWRTTRNDRFGRFAGLTVEPDGCSKLPQ